MTARIVSLIILIIATGLGFFVFGQNAEDETFPFKFGLDLVGGSHLVYKADISELESTEVDESMKALQTVLERRLNPFGTSEVQVRTEAASVFAENDENEHRVIIELPNVTDPQEAKDLIGLIPLLEFKLPISEAEFNSLLTQQDLTATTSLESIFQEEDLYATTDLTGRYIEKATVGQDHISGEILVSLIFNNQGKDLFAEITRENIGQPLAIFLDGEIISAPVIRQEIFDGNAQITGGFTIEEAQELARNLNFGALPVPIELISTQSISESLGQNVLQAGITAAIFGVVCVMIFLIFIYRVAGVVASASLLIYIVVLLSIFKLFGFVFTAAGIAGFIISIGMAVDANVLIFERIREELSSGKELRAAIIDGFARAWLAIRDSNLSSIITACILFYLTTSLVQGFALTFGFGVLVSMFTAISITRTQLLSIVPEDKQAKKKLRKHFVGSIPKLTNQVNT